MTDLDLIERRIRAFDAWLATTATMDRWRARQPTHLVICPGDMTSYAFIVVPPMDDDGSYHAAGPALRFVPPDQGAIVGVPGSGAGSFVLRFIDGEGVGSPYTALDEVPRTNMFTATVVYVLASLIGGTPLNRIIDTLAHFEYEDVTAARVLSDWSAFG